MRWPIYYTTCKEVESWAKGEEDRWKMWRLEATRRLDGWDKSHFLKTWWFYGHDHEFKTVPFWSFRSWARDLELQIEETRRETFDLESALWRRLHSILTHEKKIKKGLVEGWEWWKGSDKMINNDATGKILSSYKLWDSWLCVECRGAESPNDIWALFLIWKTEKRKKMN